MKAALFQAGVLVFLAMGMAVASYWVHPRAPALYLVEESLKADEVGMKDIQARWQGDVIWLDARPREQFTQEHIPGALPLSEQDFDQQLLEILDRLQATPKPVILYCGGQKCEASRRVREKLLTLVPLEQCFILKGGWPAWQAEQRAK